MVTWLQCGLQDAAAAEIEELRFFHDFTITVLIFILGIVRVIIVVVLSRKLINLGLLEGQVIECVWTLTPAAILVQIALPSLIILYIIDERINERLTIKAIGHQWYWSYEYSNFWRSGSKIEFDSYIINKIDRPRLIDVDNRVVLPYITNIRVLVTSADVLHSWALPSLGVKIDACPGRLNQIKLLRHRPGVFFGQCSEICGANHRFMPIRVEFISSKDFRNWVKANR